jgi:cytochrome c peroxidase
MSFQSDQTQPMQRPHQRPCNPASSRRHTLPTALAVSMLLLGTQAGAQSGNSPNQVRQFIAVQVGGLDKLKVPATLAGIPGAQLPDGTDASANPRYEMTEAKRFLGKQIFHDPVRTARIRPEFGGVLATSQTGSCGSCHQGESASKAGTLLNFNVGGEGRGYTDANGTFIPRRRANTAILPKLRNLPLFPGDALVDFLPTLTDIYANAGVSTPARGRRLPDPGALIATGRLDALDSVGRNAPGILGAAFNNRLLFGGFAGERDSIAGALNPFNDPAQENITLLLLDAHRALEAQSAVLQTIAGYRKLFREAFPAEASRADKAGDLNILINDDTVFRATATFLRSSVTRNTPFDRFVNGDNNAMTAAQLRGARLFFTQATGGQGGAGCVSCHSGPMLNKQVNDPDVAGVGKFVEENFHNLGLNDHPVQALNRQARKDPTFLDDGRREITGLASDAFKFRTVTLRQLKDAKTFMHSGEFTSVRAVVEFFNAGMPTNATAGASPTLSTRFTNPRGPGYPRGLGLTEQQVADLTNFLDNGLYDEAFVKFDPRFPNTMLQLSPVDNLYSVYRPDLAALGVRDGFPISGLSEDNNDALSRRDRGLEFLNVTSQAVPTRVYTDTLGNRQLDLYKITNNGTTVVDTHLLTVVKGLPRGARLTNGSGSTTSGEPYLRMFLDNGVIEPGQSAYAALIFNRPGAGRLNYRLEFLSGQGTP